MHPLCCPMNPKWPVSVMSCIHSFLHPFCPASDLSCIRPVLPASVLFCIHSVLHPTCPASDLSCLHQSFPASVLSCIRSVLPASVLSGIRLVLRTFCFATAFTCPVLSYPVLNKDKDQRFAVIFLNILTWITIVSCYYTNSSGKIWSEKVSKWKLSVCPIYSYKEAVYQYVRVIEEV